MRLAIAASSFGLVLVSCSCEEKASTAEAPLEAPTPKSAPSAAEPSLSEHERAARRKQPDDELRPCLQDAPPQKQGAFYMPVMDAVTVGEFVLPRGTVLRGCIKPGASIEIPTLKGAPKAEVAGLFLRRKKLDQLCAGERGGLALRGFERKMFERGMPIVAPGSASTATKISGKASLMELEFGGLDEPLRTGSSATFVVRLQVGEGTFTLPEGTEQVGPGQNFQFEAQLGEPMTVEKNLCFKLTQLGKQIGYGLVQGFEPLKATTSKPLPGK